MNIIKSSKYNNLVVLILLVMGLVLTGCSISLVSPYDEQTDKSVTELQKDVERFLTKMESLNDKPECSYEFQTAFYENVKVSLSSIKIRADAIPNNSITSEQIALLKTSLSDLENLHKHKLAKQDSNHCLTASEIEPIRSNLNISFTAILKFEIAKKRGDQN